MRQFIAENYPDANGHLAVSAEDAHYLGQVLRLDSGDVLPVRLPDGALVNMTLDKDARGKKAALILCDTLASEKMPTEKKREIAFYLFQFLPKHAKMDEIIRQATETGTKGIIPVIGEFSPEEARGDSFSRRRERRNKIIRESRQQCGSPVKTEMRDACTPADALAWWSEQTRGKRVCAAILCEKAGGTVSLRSCVDAGFSASGCPEIAAITVGCEGGIGEAEKRLFLDAGFLPVHFETNILRADTAAIYGMAAMQTAIRETTNGL